jgi:hypothetical protein
MAISPTTDILLKRSTTSGSAGNTVAGTVADALGKYVSTTAALAAIHDLFPAETGAQNAASRVDYACFFIHNAHGSLTWENVVVWISAEVSGGTAVAIGLDPTAASAVGSASVQAVTAASATTAPAGVTFLTGAAIDTEAEGLAVGNIGPGQVRAIWVRRTASNTGAVNADGATLSFAGDTAA